MGSASEWVHECSLKQAINYYYSCIIGQEGGPETLKYRIDENEYAEEEVRSRMVKVDDLTQTIVSR